MRNTIVLPEPVDYTTDELKASVAYTRQKAQIELACLLSIFNNDNESLTWDNPYRYGAPNPVISLPPDNMSHRWTLSGGLNMPYNTRLSLVGEYGKMTQDDDLLPYHADPAVTTYGSLPRSSADAEIETRLLNVNLSSRPISPLFVSAKYRHYETENNTPVDLFTYAMADGETPPIPTTPAPKNRRNQPFDYAQDKGSLDLSYRLLSRTSLNLGYDQDIIHRDERERDRTQEDTYKAGLKTNLSLSSAGVSYQNGKRRGDTYDGRAILDSHPDTPTTTTVAGPNWVNHPDLRKMDIADRDREKFNAFVTILPTENLSLGVNYSNIKDDFPNTDGFTDYNNTTIGFIQEQLGLKESASRSYTVDASYTASENFMIYAYYTNDAGRSKELGRQMGAPPATNWDSADYNWTSTIRDKNDTVGLSSNILFMKGKLTITPEYTYARSKTEIDIWGATKVTGIAPLPDLKTERHTFNLTGKYKLTDKVTLGASYLYESYTSDDWATDGMTLDDTATLPTDKPFIPLSESEPNYVAHAGSITVAYKW